MEQTLEPRKSFLELPLNRAIAINWEVAAYVAIFILAVITRFWDLGSRAMSHDESLHALYSWNLYAGKGYRHDPMMHGPFLFHINALVYFLFGASDYTARVMPAIFGVFMVFSPLLLRRWLGRTGALCASFLFLISPVILYRSRTLRHDMFAAGWTMLMLIALIQYLGTRRQRWLYIGAAAVALALSTKEVSYIHGFIGVTCVLVAMIWERAGETHRHVLLRIGTIAWVVILLVATLMYRGVLGPLVAPTGEKTLLARSYPILYLIAGFILASLLVGLVMRRWHIQEPLTSIIAQVELYPLGVSVLIFVVIFSLLHTTFFTNSKGFVSGTIGAISYWLAQQDVQRGTQPWYYYLLLMPLYEFLPMLLALVAGLWYSFTDRWPKRDEGAAGRLLLPLLIYWSITGFFMYSWAGEKMPWLMVHIVTPMILLAGRFLGDFIDAVDWRTIWRAGGGILALLLVPTLIVLWVWIGIRPFQGLSLKDLSATTQWIAALIILFLLLWSSTLYVRKLGYHQAGAVAAATGIALLAVLTIRFSYMANYINDELAKEYIVYAHATPDDKMVVNEIKALAERLNQPETIKIAYDAEVVWPFEWYFRDYRNRQYFGEKPSSQLDAPVVMIGTRRESEIKPFLGNRYVRREYKMRWWPDEGYKGLTLQRIWEVLRDPVRRQRVWNVIWRRQYEKPLNQWPHVDRFALYIRTDIVPLIWQYGASDPKFAGFKDEYLEKTITLASDLIIGSFGNGPGQLDRPKDVALDAEGNIYVSEIGNNRIQVFTPDGKYLRHWGTVGSGEGQFNEPWGIGIDTERGFLYVADTWNHRIQKFDLEGNFITQWGSFIDTGGQATGFESLFWGPRDVAVDAEGNVYVTDTGNKRIQKFDPDGNYLAQWGGAGTNPGQFNEPSGITISPTSGDIFIADTWNRRVQRFDKEFNFIKQWPVQGWNSESVVNKPYIAVDSHDNVYVSDPENYRIIQFTNEGKLLAVWGDIGAGANQLNLPTGLTVGPGDLIYVADSENHRIVRFPAP